MERQISELDQPLMHGHSTDVEVVVDNFEIKTATVNPPSINILNLIPGVLLLKTAGYLAHDEFANLIVTGRFVLISFAGLNQYKVIQAFKRAKFSHGIRHNSPLMNFFRDVVYFREDIPRGHSATDLVDAEIDMIVNEAVVNGSQSIVQRVEDGIQEMGWLESNELSATRLCVRSFFMANFRSLPCLLSTIVGAAIASYLSILLCGVDCDPVIVHGSIAGGAIVGAATFFACRARREDSCLFLDFDRARAIAQARFGEDSDLPGELQI